MSDLKSFWEDLITRFCNWVYDSVAGDSVLGLASAALVGGTQGSLVLPVDRRFGPQVLQMTGGGAGQQIDPAKADWLKDTHGLTPQASDTKRCSFWAYCHMSGFPCKLCGGWNWVLSQVPANKQDKLCPAGTTPGAMWFGCCRHPRGYVRLIAFRDCCGGAGSCGSAGQWCPNWSAAKDWCTGYGSYYCTIALNMGTTGCV